MQKLILHPDCQGGPVHSVRADIEATHSGCRARFRLQGDISEIKLPGHTQSEREDDLWKTTCFEIFWQEEGQDSYREFNLSLSRKWAAYEFDSFRKGMRNVPVGAISIVMSHSGEELTLEASIASGLPLPAKVALNAIIEDRQGIIQFWALAFPEGKPEFHNEVCRTLYIEDER